MPIVLTHNFTMNKLPLAKRIMILSMLVEGSSMRSISRVADVSINTVAKLLADAGDACGRYHYEHVRGVKARAEPVKFNPGKRGGKRGPYKPRKAISAN